MEREKDSNYFSNSEINSNFDSNMETRDFVVKMVSELREQKKISPFKIEKDLGFSNGLIGKAVNGKTKLSDEKLNKLGKYYFDKINEGRQVGYMKILSTGETELGIIENYKPDQPNRVTEISEMQKKMEELKKQFLNGK